MSLPVRYVSLGGQQIPLAFSTRAIMALEKETGTTFARIGFLLQLGRGGVLLMTQLLWSAMEGGRVRANQTRHPWTVEEVADLIDLEPGGVSEVWREPDDGIKRIIVDSKSVEVLDPETKQPILERPVIEMHPVCKAMMDAFSDSFPKAREGEGNSRPPVSGTASPPGTTS